MVYAVFSALAIGMMLMYYDHQGMKVDYIFSKYTLGNMGYAGTEC
jgi:hypothetical protein